jgi:trans-aconitate methyltransferase
VPWSGWQNAEIYHDFVAGHGIYRRLNEELIERAELESVRRVLDIGCGTGATTRAALARMSRDSGILGIDASVEMVAVAVTRTLDPRAEFRVLAAAAIDTLPARSFDCALSNAAVWQFPSLAPVVEGLSLVLRPGGRFVFNVPAERVEGERSPIHAFQAALAREIEEATGALLSRTPDSFDPGAFAMLLDRNGLTLESAETFVYRCPQSELVELMKIPAMTAPMAPGLTWEARNEVVERAAARIDPDEMIEVPWVYYSARLEGEPG